MLHGPRHIAVSFDDRSRVGDDPQEILSRIEVDGVESIRWDLHYNAVRDYTCLRAGQFDVPVARRHWWSAAPLTGVPAP